MSVKEASGVLPLSIMSTGENVIDWSITSNSGRIGKRVGINYLQQLEKTLPDGGYGIRIYASSYLSSRTVTFNSGATTGINFVFKNSDDSNISPTDVGTITISASGQPDIVISDIYQGGISTEDVGSADGHYCVGYGDDSSGRTIVYNNYYTQYIPIRCKTLPVVISENTDYTITRTGGNENIEFAYTLTKDRGEISLIWGSPSVKSIPNNETPDKNKEQWTRVDTDYARITAYGANIQIDSRPATFENCQYFAELKAGQYKVIAEGLDNTWRASAIVGDSTPYMALLSEDGSTIIQRTAIFSNTSLRFHHEEYSFTLLEDARVGLYFKALHQDGYPSYVRFMIVDSDVTAEPFTADITGGGTVSGVTCWEPFTVVLPLTISAGSESQTINVDLVRDYIYPGRIVTSSMSATVLPTYYGQNAINCSIGSPLLWLRYDALENVIESRLGEINVYDISEPQLGFQHNGLAILMPYEVTSDKEDKGRWELTLKHPMDKYGKWTYIVGQNILKVGGQLYRIVETETYLDSKQEYIYARAKHISYDMADYWVNEAEISASNGADYIYQLNAARINDFPNQQHIIGEYVFDVTSDLDGPIENKLQDQSIISALFGNDNALASFGGQLYRDNFHVSINKNMEKAPEGRAFAIRYGTDLTKISFKIDFSEWITNLIGVDNFGSMVAVWYDTSGDWIVHHHKTKRVHFTYSEMGDPDSAVERLDRDVMALWGEVSTPKISVVVSVAAIKNDPKYKDFVNLQNYDVGYIGTVYVEHLGIDVEMRIVAIKRNELTGEAIQITLGNTRTSLIRQTVLSQTISSPNSVQGKLEANMQREIDNLQLKQMSTWGGCKRYTWAQLKKYKWEEIKNGHKNN